MELVVILGALVALAGAGVVAWRRVAHPRALPPADPRASSRGLPSVFSLKPGDVVQHAGTDYIIETSLAYSEEGATWQSHLLGGGAHDVWLVVEEDDEVVVALCEEIEDDLSLGAGDPPRNLSYKGVSYRQVESGTATAKRTTTENATPQTLTCRYWDYQGPDRQVLYIEDWPGERELFQGRKVSPAVLTILPGS